MDTDWVESTCAKMIAKVEEQSRGKESAKAVTPHKKDNIHDKNKVSAESVDEKKKGKKKN